MSTEENKAATRRLYEGLITGNLNLIESVVDKLFTDNRLVHRGAQPAVERGRVTFMEGLPDFYAGLRDLHGTLDDIFAEGDKVAVRWTLHWTEVATGKSVRFLVVDIHRFVNGKIAETWNFNATAE